MFNCNWSPRPALLSASSFPSDGLNVRLRFTRRWRALHLIQGETSLPPPKETLRGD